jgi:transcriptional regulator with XRE-family HTH domain
MYNRFRQLLDQKGITPYKVAKDTGISQGTLSDWKRGKCKPKLDKLIKIAEYLGVPLEDFIKEETKTG